MLRGILILLNVAAILLTIPTAAAAGSDEGFVKSFVNYRNKHKISTLRTAEAFAKHQKRKPEQVLNRYISAQFVSSQKLSQNLSAQEMAVVYGLEAFKELGLTHEQALSKISDLTGQLSETIDSIAKQNQIRNGRGVASVR